jgi:putative phage-type endonuclease
MYKKSFNIHPQVKKLNEMPQVAQRSAEWFQSRKTRITASELGTVLGVNPYATRNAYWKDKLAVLRNEPEKERTSSWISEWGVRYEPVVQNMIRKRFTNCFVEQETQPDFKPETLFEYGMVCHPRVPFLGASPDGILFDGTMIEIKCPPTRQIESHEVVPYYYSQMQLQMECCELDVVEFIECKFYEYRSLQAFHIDSMQQAAPKSVSRFFTSADDKPKGAIACAAGKYIYFDHETQDFESWYAQHKETPDSKVYLWKLELFSSKMIRRNPLYIANMIQEATLFWNALTDALEKNTDTCRLPSPRPFLFENFIFDDIMVVYKKKADLSSSPDGAATRASAPAKRKFSFTL